MAHSYKDSFYKLYDSLFQIGERIEREPEWAHIKLNGGILANCVQSILYDLDRTKDFHCIEEADRHKRAAYTMKWIARLRPLQLLTDKKSVKRSLLLVNEAYAFAAGFSYLQADRKNISISFLRNLLYTLHFRNIDGGIFSASMYLLERACNKETP